MLETALTLLTISFFGRMSPGPDMMLLIRHSAGDKRAVTAGSSLVNPAFACLVGICIGLILHVSFSILGLALVIKSHPLIFSTLRYAGAVYLIYIGWKSFSAEGCMDITAPSAGAVQKELVVEGGGNPLWKGFREGLFCNILNPKVTIFVLSVFMQLVSPDAPLGEKVVYGSVIVGEAIVGWTIFILFLKTSFMQRLYGKYGTLINKITGVILLLLGSAVFIAG
ncbi:MAG: LysE family translocator [Desulfovibrio sp.]